MYLCISAFATLAFAHVYWQFPVVLRLRLHLPLPSLSHLMLTLIIHLCLHLAFAFCLGLPVSMCVLQSNLGIDRCIGSVQRWSDCGIARPVLCAKDVSGTVGVGGQEGVPL